MKSILQWLEARTGFGHAWRSFADQAVQGGPRLRHVFPAVLVYLFVQQAILGIILAAYYSPSATDAWASTAYLEDQVSMGWFVRGMHYHGTSVFIVVAVLYMLTLAVFRIYQKPRELLWVASLVVVALGLAFGLTGNPLPWDEQGYWSIQVELGIAEQTPGGEIIRTLIQGGNDAGNFTILRLFVIHAFVLPVALALVLAFIAAQMRKHGAPAPAGMAEDEAKLRAVPYVPSQLFLDVTAMTVVAGACVGLTMASGGAELFAPADPTSGFQARPEWYFLFLYKLRMLFEGPMEPVATMVIPGGVATFLLVAPFLEQKMGRTGRLLVLTGLGVVMTGVVALTGLSITNDAENESYQESLELAATQAEQARTYAKEGVVPQGGPAVFWNDPQYQVKELYEEHCLSCHELDGFGGGEAPVLTDYSSRAWLSELIRDPSTPKFFGKTEHDGMEAYPVDEVSEEQLAATVEYLVKLSGDPLMKVDEALAAKGAELWEDELDCNICHEIEKGLDADGPNMLGHGSQAWVRRVIRDSSADDLFGSAASMPKFADKLSDEEIAQLAAFVVGQRHEGVIPVEPMTPEEKDPPKEKAEEADEAEAEDAAAEAETEGEAEADADAEDEAEDEAEAKAGDSSGGAQE